MSPAPTVWWMKLATSCSEQGLRAAIVLTSSANAVVPKGGSEAYDISKSAVSHLVRELAVSLAPQVRVNGVSPATVVEGSTMFPRDRVIKQPDQIWDRVSRYGVHRRTAQQTGALLCPTHADQTERYSAGLCGSHLLAGQRPRCENHRPPDSRGWRVGGGVSAVAEELDPCGIRAWISRTHEPSAHRDG